MIQLVLGTVICTVLLAQRTPQEFHINLSLPAESRYINLTTTHRQQILSFLNYLYSSPLYQAAFSTASYLHNRTHLLDPEFYSECLGIAKVLNVPVSDIIVFNYMYELGSFRDFCTSVIIKTDEGRHILGRNLDYGFQSYLANSTVVLVYEKEGKELARIAGHSGFIGCHTAMRTGAYAVTLNERIEGGLRDTLKAMLEGCEEVPYLLRRVVLSCDNADCAIKRLSQSNLCSAVYFIVASQTQNVVIQRNRLGVHSIYNLNSQPTNFIVQTNTDRDQPDPDGRRVLAEMRLSNTNLTSSTLRDILLKYPNKNSLTLMTVMMNPFAGSLNATVWLEQSVQS